ncbi:MAG: FAD-binding oxidoreductase [Chloroflexota bacterium]
MRKLSLLQLRESIKGTVTGPDDGGYDDARTVYNAMIDRRPAVLVRAEGTADVATAVNYARENELPIAIRGGGHSVPGFGTIDDGIVIDLSGMRGVSVDATRKTARAQGGATWGDFNDATHEHSLATTGGIISTTGVGGLTLGGGIGYLTRGLGLACDNLVGAEVVTADGETVKTSATENADLLWALKGGSGNFGVATALEFQLHPLKDIYGGPMFFEMEHAGDILRWFRDYIADAPEQFGGFPLFQIAPPLPFIPEDRHGDTFIAFVACWAGPLDEGEAIVNKIKAVAPVVAEHVGPMPYPALNSAFDGLVPAGLQHYWKANFARELTDEAIAAHLEHGPKVPVVNSTTHLYPINGAVQRVTAEESAFGHRDATFAPVIAGMWPDPADNDANIAWVRDYYEAIAPHSEEGGYVNFVAGDDQGRVKANYGANYDRLVTVKRQYDPDNLFRNNQNIKP